MPRIAASADHRLDVGEALRGGRGEGDLRRRHDDVELTSSATMRQTMAAALPIGPRTAMLGVTNF
jgi:hypothetical protein